MEATATPSEPGGGADPAAGDRLDGRAADAAEPSAPRRLALWLRIAICAVLPLLYTLPGMLPGMRFLPMAPVAFAPLSLEHPAAAEAARRGQSYATVDRLFPTLTDQLELRERVLAGESPLWEPDQGLGLSLIGNTLSGPFYPPNALAVLLPPDRAAPLLAAFVLTWVALGLWALLARIGHPERACLIAALASQAAGFGVANLHYGMKVDAVAWLPWSLWAIEGLVRGRRFSAAQLAVCLGLPFLAGFPPIAVFAAGAALVYAVVRLAPLAVSLLSGGRFERRAGNRALGALAGAGSAFLVGPLLGAIQLLPTLQASGESYRVPKDAAQLELEALSPRTWIGVPLADVYGLPTDAPAPLGAALAWVTEPAASSARTQQAVPLEWNAYAGAAAFLLALIGLTMGRRALFPALLVLGSFGFAQAWPGVRWLYHVPGLDGGAPARALAVAWIGWAWLAGLGACALAGRRRWVRGLGLGLGALGLAAGLALVGSELDPAALAGSLAERYDVGPDEVQRYVPAEQAQALARNLARAGRALALGSGLVVLAALLSGSARRAKLGTLALVAALALEALLFSRVHVLPRDLGGLPLLPASPGLEAVREAAGEGRVLRLDLSSDGISEVIELARPNLLHAYDIADLTPYVAFTPRSLVEAFERVDPRGRFRSGISGLHDPAALADPWLDRAGVTCVLSLGPIAHPSLELVHARPRFHVYRRATGAPERTTPVEDPADAAGLALRLGAGLSALALAAVVLLAFLGRRGVQRP